MGFPFDEMAKRLIGFWPSVVVSTAAKTCQSCRCSVCGGGTFLTTGNEFRGQQYSVGAAHRYCHDERNGGVTGNDFIWRGEGGEVMFGVGSVFFCWLGLAIEGHRGVASLANTARYGKAMRLALRSDGCAQPTTSDRLLATCNHKNPS